MSCNCLRDLRKLLERNYQTTVELQTETLFNLATGKPTAEIVPPLQFKYRRNGKGRVLTGHLRARFCQFCGVSLLAETKAKPPSKKPSKGDARARVGRARG